MTDLSADSDGTAFVPWVNSQNTESADHGKKIPSLHSILTFFLKSEVAAGVKAGPLACVISREKEFQRGPSSSKDYYYLLPPSELVHKFDKTAPPYLSRRYISDTTALNTNLDGLDQATKDYLLSVSLPEFTSFDILKKGISDLVLHANYTPCKKAPKPKGKRKAAGLETIGTPDQPITKSRCRSFPFSEQGDETSKAVEAAGKAILAQPSSAQQFIDCGLYLERLIEKSPRTLKSARSGTPLSPLTRAAHAQIQGGRLLQAMQKFERDVVQKHQHDQPNKENN